jgi:hypothetical protein
MPVSFRTIAVVAAHALVLSGLCLLTASSAPGQRRGKPLTFPNAHGVAETITTTGTLDTRNAFFASTFGTNGRSCVTCHQPDSGWSITPKHIKARFEATGGMDPLFRLVDGANSLDADVSTRKARRQAYSMLLKKGLIRVDLPIPPDAEFELAAAEDPYGYAHRSELSCFRRPLPSTNLRFLSAVMWDGRETTEPLTIQPYGTDESANVAALLSNLLRQSNNATRVHAEAAQDLTDAERQQIVALEMSLFTAQRQGNKVGSLDRHGALGGPASLLTQRYYIGINDNVADPYGPFDGRAMRLYDAWLTSPDPRRRSVARGEALFNTLPIILTGVKGLNDNPYFGRPPVVVGTCTTCHNTPNVGNHSLAVPLDIGVSDASRRTPDMPLYTLRHRTSGETIQTTDPGRALITGKWDDIGRFKGPVLRALAARPPYFHNGSADTLDDVVDFYNERFGIGMTQRQKDDLTAFLENL